MYAVIKTGGKQYKVSVGDKLKVEQIPADIDSKIELSEVLMIADGDAVTFRLRHLVIDPQREQTPAPFFSRHLNPLASDITEILHHHLGITVHVLRISAAIHPVGHNFINLEGFSFLRHSLPWQRHHVEVGHRLRTRRYRQPCHQ